MHGSPSRYQLAEIGGLLADPSRAAILLALTDGRARPAGELARLAGIAPSTASAHLGRLVEGGLLQVLNQGRHRYFQVAGDHVCAMLEVLPLAQPRPRKLAPSERPLAFARTCYRHLAGYLGVALYRQLREQGWIELGDQAVRLSEDGRDALRAHGLLPDGAGPPGPPGRSCLDWTERRLHLGGPLGVAITDRLLQRDWLRRHERSRALVLTPPGRAGLRRLGIPLDD